MSTSQLLAQLFAYKAWANEELFASVGSLDEGTHRPERHAAIRILNHTWVVDRIFAANLQRVAHGYRATNTEETPTLERLLAAVRESDRWYIGYVAGLGPAELTEDIDFVFSDGERGRMTREEILAHVIVHGGYHRGAVGRVLSQASIAPPRDVFTGFLHKTGPTRRQRA